MIQDWYNSDGTANYKKYIGSLDWRRFKEGYWKQHPNAVCSRCGMDNKEHQEKYSTRLHLHHLTYQTLGREADEDLEVICKRCHKQEHNGQIEPYRWSLGSQESGTDWYEPALERISVRRQKLMKTFDENDSRLWRELENLVELENYVRYCQAEPKPTQSHLLRLVNCRPESIRSYRKAQAGEQVSLEILIDLEEHGLCVLFAEGVHWVGGESQ